MGTWVSDSNTMYPYILIHDGLTTTTGLTNFRELQAPQATPPPGVLSGFMYCIKSKKPKNTYICMYIQVYGYILHIS